MSTFNTGSGDDGYTGILGKDRLPKHHERLETLGTIDEAGAALGFARAWVSSPTVREIIVQVQRDLYQIMAEVAATPENAAKFHQIGVEKVIWLEEHLENLKKSIEIPNEFILPGDSQGGAALDLARTVIRRAERRLSAMVLGGQVENNELLRYLNRLSALCFMLELNENKNSGLPTPTLAKTSLIKPKSK